MTRRRLNAAGLALAAQIKYQGPDQRKEERCIVLGMACPRCSGPVHDPQKTRDKYAAAGFAPNWHSAFACMDPKCGWDSRHHVGSQDYAYRKARSEKK